MADDSLEARVVRHLRTAYPVSVEDLRRALRVSEVRIRRALLRLERRGIVTVEPLPGATYVRLLAVKAARPAPTGKPPESMYR